MDVGAGGSGQPAVDHLRNVLQAPELWERGIVRFGETVDDVVGLCVEKIAAAVQPLHQRERAERLRTHAPDAEPPDWRDRVGVSRRYQVREFRSSWGLSKP